MNENHEVNFVALAHFSNSIDAGQVSELLENNGIRSILQGVNFGGLEPLLLPGGYSEITLLVADTELEQAQQLYEAFFEQNPETVLSEGADVSKESKQ